MKEEVIKVRGARQHNLKNVDLDIPKHKLVVFTGVSGSGKSSLAFDTIYAEGQRRYVESLSSYARQFLGVMEKPDVDLIEGLSPAISIDQKTTSHNPRSTVGTVTEIYDYLRLLFARVGHPHCPICGREISKQSLDQIVDQVLALISKTLDEKKLAKFLILSPVVQARKGEFTSLFDNLKSKGYKQARVDGHVKNLTDDFVLIKTNKHTIEAVIDRIGLSKENFKDTIFFQNLKSRLSESIQASLNLSDGLTIFAEILDTGFEIPEFPKSFNDTLFSERFACPVDNISLPEIEPRTFSFNSPEGACQACSGLGKILKADQNLILSPEISIIEGGILPFSTMFEHDTWYSRLLLAVCYKNDIDVRVPIAKLTKAQLELLFYGTGDREYKVEGTNKRGKITAIWQTFIGVINELERRFKESQSDWVREEIQKYMREQICPMCEGKRLKKESLGITVDDLSISDATSFSIEDTLSWINKLSAENSPLSTRETEIGKLVLKEIVARLNFLTAVGLEYLSLGRVAATLSGGEAQRIRLASQIGSGLTGVLYVLDEPTVGLHPRDNQKLIDTLKKLKDLGNTVIVVEHDTEMMNSADYIFDFGPAAGKHGGEITAQGTPDEIKKDPNSLTGKYLSGEREIKIGRVPLIESLISYDTKEIDVTGKSLNFYGCNQFNLKNIDVELPLGKLICITGVSGSGKSTLLVDTIYPALARSVNPFFKGEVAGFSRMTGEEYVKKVILVDQSPIGRTPRSNPATYTGIFDPIREVFSKTREARSFGFGKARFSFNLRGGRCEACEGQGQIKIEMQFMSDIWVTCDICHGKRYNAQTLEVLYKGKNIAEVLELTIDEAREFFHAHPKIMTKLDTLSLVGLDYMQLGQAATTLSGGEAQRVKLATELGKRAASGTFYILDEPTTGLHFADVERLLRVLKLLVGRGSSVCVIEHNLDIIKNSDWVIDLGPNGGDTGGNIVAAGTIEDIKKAKNSFTGHFL